jgi:hypothetical protein
VNAKKDDQQTEILGHPEQKPYALATYIALAAGAFLAALGVLVIMLYKHETLVQLGLVGNLYYVVLIPLGVATAVCLFGVLNSYAVYSGHVLGGTLKLGGPIVVFMLVVVLGLQIPIPQAFSLTVFVHGEKGLQDVVLRNSGRVLLDLGADRRSAEIGDKGQAYFIGIPAIFRGQDVFATIEADSYESISPKNSIKIEGEVAYLAVRPRTVELAGYVRSDAGEPISGATVSVMGTTGHTDSTGFFKMTVLGAGLRQDVTMQVTAPGYVTWRSRTSTGAEITVMLDRVLK